MNLESDYHYPTIAKTISYLSENLKQKPGLDQVAAHLNLGPSELQQVFIGWSGLEFEEFTKHVNTNYYKQLLNKSEELNLFSQSLKSDSPNLKEWNNLSIEIGVMTSEETKSTGEKLNINYSFAFSPFGEILMASTAKGLCYLVFFDNRDLALDLLKQSFPKARFQERLDDFQRSAVSILQRDSDAPKSIQLHLKGTNFQLKVWKALLNISVGDLTTYGKIALEVGSPNAARAVGTAIGSNPVSIIIPCHRVIQSSGNLGGYMWGLTRKKVILGWEAGKVNETL